MSDIVWPPPDSELDSYTFPLEPGDRPAQTPVSDSIAAWQTDVGQSTEPEAVPVLAQGEASDAVITSPEPVVTSPDAVVTIEFDGLFA